MPLIVLWCLSPLFLIPWLIVTLRKNKKLSDFVADLLKNGRINFGEYTSLHSQNQNGQVQNQPSQPYPQNPPYQPYQPHQPYQPYPQYQPNQPYRANPKERKSVGSGTVLFIIGVIFIILAGVIFSTAAWVYMSKLQRVGTIFSAALFFFAASVFSRRKLKLDGTGMAFYLLGSVFGAISFLSAGVYKLMGGWLSVGGKGEMTLFSLASLIVAIMSAVGIFLYKKDEFVHTALGFSSLAYALALGQLCRTENSFFFALCLLPTALILFIYIYTKKVHNLGDTPSLFPALKISSAVITAIVTILAVIFLIGRTVSSEWNVWNYLCGLLIFIQLTFYGIRLKDRRLTSVQCFMAMLIACAACIDRFELEGSLIAGCAALLVLTVVYRFCKRIRTVFSDIALPAATIILGISLADISTAKSAAVFLLLAVAMSLFAFEKGKPHLCLHRIFLPLTLILAANSFADSFGSNSDFAAYGIACILLTFAAFVFLLGDEDKRLSLLHYSFSAAACVELILTLSCMGGIGTVSVGIVAIVLCTAVYFVCTLSDVNLLSALPVGGFFSAAIYIAKSVSDSRLYDFNSRMTAEFVALAVLSAVLMAVSQILYKERFFQSKGGSISSEKNTVLRIDFAAFGAVFAPINILSECEFTDSESVWKFAALIVFALAVLNFCRSRLAENCSLVIKTLSLAVACAALYNQPFFDTNANIFVCKYTLVPLIVFGQLAKIIWHSRKKIAKNLSFAANLTALILLLCDAIKHDVLFNSLLILCFTLVLLICSIARKSKRWFVSAAVSLVGLTLYIMRDFLSEIDWWLYLLLVGILLIFIAAVGEYCKSHGESFKHKVGKLFADWDNGDND